MLDSNQRPRDSGWCRFRDSLDYLTTLHVRCCTHRVPGARGVLIDAASRTLVSAPSRLPRCLRTSATRRAWLTVAGRLIDADGFPEFTRFFHRRLHAGVTLLMSPLL